MNWQPLREVKASPIGLAVPGDDVGERATEELLGDSILPEGKANQILQAVWSDHLSLVKESMVARDCLGGGDERHIRENELKKQKEKIVVKNCVTSFAEKTLVLEQKTEESFQALEKRLLRMQSVLPVLQSALSQYKGKYATACNMLVDAKKETEELKTKYLTRERILKRIIEDKDEETQRMEQVVKSVVVKVQSLFDTFSDEVGYLNDVRAKLEEIAAVLPKGKPLAQAEG